MPELHELERRRQSLVGAINWQRGGADRLAELRSELTEVRVEIALTKLMQAGQAPITPEQLAHLQDVLAEFTVDHAPTDSADTPADGVVA